MKKTDKRNSDPQLLKKHPKRTVSRKSITETTETPTKEDRSTDDETCQTPSKVLRLYQCTLCDYKDTNYESNNLKDHMRTHCKPIECGVCNAHFKFFGDASIHSKKEHPDESENIITNIKMMSEFNKIYNEALASVTACDEEEEGQSTSKDKNTQCKSKSAPFERKVEEGFSYYGCKPKPVDLKTLRMHVEVNKINMPVTVEQLGRMFDLNPTVVVVDCNWTNTRRRKIKLERGENDAEEVWK